MGRIRKILALAVGALVVGAALSAPASAEVTPELLARKTLAAAETPGARAAALPAAVTAASPVSPWRRSAGFAAVARAVDGERVLVGIRRPDDVDGLASELRRLGEGVRVFRMTSIIALTAPDPAALARLLRDDPRVAFVDADTRYRNAVEPAESVDPETRLTYGWAYDVISARAALDRVGGGSQRTIAVIDSGFDLGHPDLFGPQTVFNSASGGNNVFDADGHGTFVLGTMVMADGNGIGGRGVAGRTPTFGIKGSIDGQGYPPESVVAGIEAAIRAKASIINMSFAGTQFTAAQGRAMAAAFLADVLPVAAAGNTADEDNAVSYPAAQIGGRRGAIGLGLSVGAVNPNGLPADFSTNNDFVSLAAPGDFANGDCRHGVFSTVPRHATNIFDSQNRCQALFQDQLARWAYNDGTSFSSPIVAGVAALVWQANPKLLSQQVGHVLQRTARQFIPGAKWNRFTGTGAIDAARAVDLAPRYDTTDPTFRVKATRRGSTKLRVRVEGGRDRTERGDELAGGLTYSVQTGRRRDGDDARTIVSSRRPITRDVSLGSKPLYVFAFTCDANENCALKRSGPYRTK